MKEKSVKEDCDRCRFKCNEKVTEEQRQEIFSLYYSLGSYERQRIFISSYTGEKGNFQSIPFISG